MRSALVLTRNSRDAVTQGHALHRNAVTQGHALHRNAVTQRHALLRDAVTQLTLSCASFSRTGVDPKDVPPEVSSDLSESFSVWPSPGTFLCVVTLSPSSGRAESKTGVLLRRLARSRLPARRLRRTLRSCGLILLAGGA